MASSDIVPNIEFTNGFKDYNIVKQLSHSKYTVYRAYNTQLKQEVAIKVFPVEGHPDKNFCNEKTTLARFDHPNVIKVIETIDEVVAIIEKKEKLVSCICFEYASYGDLYEIICEHGEMPELLVRTLFHSLLEAVEHIHLNGIVHSDIKLENILLDKDYNLKVIDFDLSQPLDSKRLIAKGTPNYRAPEIKKGICYNLKAADIYSLGVTLFVMMNGNPPYVEVDRGNEYEYDALFKLLGKNNKRFWEIHAKERSQQDFFSEEFKDLINTMLAEEVKHRITLENIKSSKWFNGPVLDKESYPEQMKTYLQKKI